MPPSRPAARDRVGWQRGEERDLQDSLLPPLLPAIPGLDAAAAYLPAGHGVEVVGDFYDLFEADGHWCAVMGDVVGHGVEAAKLTALARYTIRTEAAVRPSEVLGRLHEAMTAQQGHRKMLTVALATLRPGPAGVSGILCSAGHEPALIRRGDGRIDIPPSRGQLLGATTDVALHDTPFVLHPAAAASAPRPSSTGCCTPSPSTAAATLPTTPPSWSSSPDQPMRQQRLRIGNCGKAADTAHTAAWSKGGMPVAGRIEDYGLIGDLHTAALVGADGSIDWLCLPRFDSPACFAALLDDPGAGRWLLAPASGGRCTRRRYRGDSLVLETEWDTPDGTVRVVDAMPPRGEAADVVRVVEGVSGRVPMAMELVLRLDYGAVVPWVRHHDGGLTAVAGPDAVTLACPVGVHGRDGASHAVFTVGAGERVPFVLDHTASHLPRPRPVDGPTVVADTERFWADWIARCDYRGEWAEPVRRSLITLKALTYAPTGGIVAAATTSLPEELGGMRNWDYRYCWLRDATFTLQALLGTGYVEEARAWREWLLRAVAGDPADLQIMYGLHGERRLPESTLGWLAGYEGSAPVRIGNAAAAQFQLDVWGEVLDGLHTAREAGLAPSEDAWDLQRALLDFLEGNWDTPDNSLWEVRGPTRPYVHSRVLAWAGVDRGVQAVERFGLDGPVGRWRELRARIHEEVCAKGFDAGRGTFTQFYGSEGLDAALLLIPRVGFLPWSDERVVGTVDAVQRELGRDGLLLRYDVGADGGDGLAGDEGEFLICAFWLADALHGIGRTREARALFERLLGLRNDLGLLAEEYDTRLGRQLGNTPQAFSHLGLVNTARHLGAVPA